MSSTRVFVTGSGGAAAIAFFNAIRTGPFDVHMGDLDPHAAGLYLVPASHRHLLPRGDGAAFVPALLDLCRALEIDLLVPTVDCELLPIAERLADFEQGGTRVLVAARDTLQTCLDKWSLIQACADLDVTPRTALLDEAFDPDDWSFPIVAKPRRGSGSRGVRLCASAAGLAGLSRMGDLIVQEYLPGEEYSVDVLTDPFDGGVRAAVPRARLKVDSGIAVTSRTVRDDRLLDAAAMVAARVGLTFVGNVQLRRDERGRPRLLEVNPRFPGTMPLTVASGINMPRLAVEAALGRPLLPGPYPYRDVAVVRTWQDHFFAPEELLPSAGVVEVS